MKELKKFTQFLKENESFLQTAELEKYGELANKKHFDPHNPEIVVKSHGIKKLKEIKKCIEEALEEILKDAKRGKMEAVEKAMKEAHSLQTHIKAFNEAARELESPEIKERKEELIKIKEEKKKLKSKSAEKIEENDEEEIEEATPPSKGVESWIKKNKKKFYSQYGKKKGKSVLYALAWKKFNKSKK